MATVPREDVWRAAAKRGWNLTIRVRRRDAKNVAEISRQMKKGSTLTISLSAPVDDTEAGFDNIRSQDSFTSAQLKEFCDSLSEDISIVFSY
ncbi:hypothetical protein ACQRKX_004878 [Enterobacter cloacae]